MHFALSHHGLVEPSPYLIIYHLEPSDVGRLVGQLDSDLPDVLRSARFVRVGVGLAEGDSTTVVIALQEGAVSLEPVARELPHGGRLRLRGHVLDGFRRPRVYVTGAGGAVADVPVVRDGDDGFRAEVACGDTAGRVEIEVMAEDKTENPTVLANFPVWCGQEPPASMELQPRAQAPREAAEAEAEVLRLCNQERQKAGLAALTWDARATTIARAHATEMRDKAYVAHVSPTTGTPLDRARAGGLGTPLLLENLARAQSAEEAHGGIMSSPGHRGNLLNPRATHVGIGVALAQADGRERDLYLTEVFFRKTPKRDPEELRRAVTAAITAERGKRGMSALGIDEDLGTIAQHQAAGLAAGKEPSAVGRSTDHELDSMHGRYQQVVTVVSTVGEPEDAVRDVAFDGRVRAMGVGVAQGSHKEIGEGALFVVMLFGRAR